MMKPADIKKNLETRAAIAQKLSRAAMKRYGDAGYNIDGLGRASLNEGGATGDFAGPATTKTINGKTYIQRDGKWFEQ